MSASVTRRALLAAAAPALVLGACSFTGRNSAPAIIHRYHRPRPAADADHAVVYRREDEFCAWTYTRGFWEDGNGHLMQNFDSLTVDYEKLDAEGITHNNIFARSTGRRMLTVRSTDRGVTWNGDNPEVDLMTRDIASRPTFAESGPIDWSDRNTLLYSAFNTRNLQVSKDAGRTWSAPSPQPLEGLKSLVSLSSYLVRPDGRCLHFMYETENGWKRRPVVYASVDGGTEFHFLSFITPKEDPWGNADGEYRTTAAYGGHRWFYPRAILLPGGRILCSLRCQRDPQGVMWSEVYASDDGGRTWGFLSRINDFGAPASLVRMSDGRIVAVYGYRLPDYGIRAAVSEDGGRTWGGELVVRDDGGSWDLGYPNAWEVSPGRVGCIYYFNSKHDPVQITGGKRHIARSIFSI
ncbi:MAG: sialidase family protein [Pseudomonadota bacterium]